MPCQSSRDEYLLTIPCTGGLRFQNLSLLFRSSLHKLADLGTDASAAHIRQKLRRKPKLLYLFVHALCAGSGARELLEGLPADVGTARQSCGVVFFDAQQQREPVLVPIARHDPVGPSEITICA